MNNRKFRYRIATLLSVLALLSAGCSDDTTENTAQRDRLVTDLLVPGSTFYTSTTKELTIQGKGFAEGDALALADVATGTEIPLTLKAIDHAYVTFAVPQEIPTGSYRLVVHRGRESQVLGILKFRRSLDLEIPDKEGMNVKGVVFCGSLPVAGVVVSDGEVVTTTDDAGCYYLASKKHHGYVFMSVPSGYEPQSENSVPLIWGPVTPGEEACEQVDFELVEAPGQDDFDLLVLADIHLANRLGDIAQYKELMLPEVKNYIAASPRKVYIMNVGDMTFDLYWNSNKYNLGDYTNTLKDSAIPALIYHVPGNHDNERFVDPEIPDALWDSIAQRPYRQIIGPNYYSFNLGKVHFVMLDNIIVRKGALKNSRRPSRNDYQLDERQLRWLGRDLETIGSGTPLVVCMHVPVADWTGIGSDGTPEFAAKESQQTMYDQIMPLLARFDDVRFLTGHNHRFINIPLTDRIFQHTLVSASAVSWKINGPESRLVSEDGSPGGYLILRYRGGRADWQFKPNGYRADRNQFRVYDLNRVPEEFGGQPGSNRCLINVYNWDERWTVRVRENGRDLKVEQVWAKDPLYILIRRDALPTRPTAFRAVANPHMFAVEASAPDTPLEVTVTDRFGRKYRQTVERPKRFDWRTE